MEKIFMLENNIEKFEAASFSKEDSGFTQLSNLVIQNIDNPVAFHVWAYLQSKPATWVPNRTELKNHFKVSFDRLAKTFTYLKRSNLIEVSQERGADGRMGKYHIRVLNGSKFIKITDETDAITNNSSKLSTEDPEHRPMKTAPPGSAGAEVAEYINKEYIQTKIIKNKDRSRSDFTNEEIEVRDLVRKEFKDDSFTTIQAKFLLSLRTNDGRKITKDGIIESIANCLAYCKEHPKSNRLAYFINAMKKDGYFANKKQFTKDKENYRQKPTFIDPSHKPFKNYNTRRREGVQIDVQSKINDFQEKGSAIVSELLKTLKIKQESNA
jgi:DNA-binding transcriptional regulator YhcF (GntR family)